MMATALNKLGLTTWFSNWVVTHVQGYTWMAGFALLSIVYFYSHYFFASNVAHVGSMYPPFFLLAIALGTPIMLAALVLGFFSSLFGGLTHYGCGPAPILFGAGYVKIAEWWKLGFIVSLVNIAIWLLVGTVWWKLIGIF
jgi:DASS family divalent anion:Na+ symporter